jgi:YidC/Oxa1 family membrane protein insertase
LNPWDLIVVQPITNLLIILAHYLFGSFGLAIIILTILFNLLLYPITLRQMKVTKSTQELQPKLAELQKKFGKDQQRMAQEQMKLYKESGISPLGCVVPLLIQTPIWIALYQSIIHVMAVNPESFVNLSRYLYPWHLVYAALPVSNHFLWLNLGTPDILLAVLVGAAMWVQQKMSTPTVSTPQTQAQTQTMQVMMPVMFFFFSMTFASGLSLYWVISNLIRIVMQYLFSGWGGLIGWGDKVKNLLPLRRGTLAVQSKPDSGSKPVQPAASQIIEGKYHEANRDKRSDGGGSNPPSTGGAGPETRSGRDRGPKRR